MIKKRTTRNTKYSITKKDSTSTLPLNIEIKITLTVSTPASTTFPEIPSVVIDDFKSKKDQLDKRVKLNYRREIAKYNQVTDQPVLHKVPIFESLVDDSDYCIKHIDEIEITDSDNNANNINTIQLLFFTTEDQNSALKILLNSNNLAPLFATNTTPSNNVSLHLFRDLSNKILNIN
ncbi:hypothetical protein C1646_758072 [Rhizophagus diaphanus]|nr:hypothetical protein C1646_758072 [Rhizophagus diaphanus] [Rhizophagus sp. MUCL 43196]